MTVNIGFVSGEKLIYM